MVVKHKLSVLQQGQQPRNRQNSAEQLCSSMTHGHADPAGTGQVPENASPIRVPAKHAESRTGNVALLEIVTGAAGRL